MIPATGVFAPERTFVAVRAIAPVAGNPPNIGEMKLATPCAKSSTFELCLVWLMRSATTAESSDSMAPSIATVNVGESSVSTRSGLNLGMWISGRPEGMPPKRMPIVSSGRFAIATTAVPATSATM
jgi:hypothetical protein